MQKVSMVTFDPFAGERSGFLTNAWRKTSRIWSKATMMDEIEYDLKRLETRMGVNALSAKKAGHTLPIFTGKSRISIK